MLDSDVILAVYNLNRSLQELSLKRDQIDEAIESLLELKKDITTYTQVAADNVRNLYTLIANGKGSITKQ